MESQAIVDNIRQFSEDLRRSRQETLDKAVDYEKRRTQRAEDDKFQYQEYMDSIGQAANLIQKQKQLVEHLMKEQENAGENLRPQSLEQFIKQHENAIEKETKALEQLMEQQMELIGVATKHIFSIVEAERKENKELGQMRRNQAKVTTAQLQMGMTLVQDILQSGLDKEELQWCLMGVIGFMYHR